MQVETRNEDMKEAADAQSIPCEVDAGDGDVCDEKLPRRRRRSRK